VSGEDGPSRDATSIDGVVGRDVLTTDVASMPDTAALDGGVEASLEAGVEASVEATAPDAGCTRKSCSGAGFACDSRGQCVEDCRPASGRACDSTAVCDFTDGRCRTWCPR
jgi:hypothetical protein